LTSFAQKSVLPSSANKRFSDCDTYGGACKILAAYSKGKELTRVSGALPAPSLEQFVQKARQDAG
jgi:hypothetical protein